MHSHQCQSFAYICEACIVKGLRSSIPLVQARIHTGFHYFTEIGQIFHNRDIKQETFQVARLHPIRRNWPISQYPVSMTQKPRKGDFGKLKSKKFPWGACRWTPLETCAFGARLGNRSVFVIDPCL